MNEAKVCMDITKTAVGTLPNPSSAASILLANAITIIITPAATSGNYVSVLS